MGDDTREQVRQALQGAEALGSLMERYLIRLLGPLGRKISEATTVGRFMALAGVMVVAVSALLIVVDATSLRIEASKGALVATEPVVNVRSRASAKSNVVVTVREGQRMTYLGYEGGWYKVRARGAVGWVPKDLVDRKGNRTVVIEYEMRGYGIVFLAGALVFAAGILQKQRRS